MKKRIASFFTAAAMCLSVTSGIKDFDFTAETETQAAASYPVQEFRMGISNTNRNINISGTKSGSALNSWTTNGVDNENWTLNYISAGVYEIVNVATGYVITNNNGTAVISPDVDGANQRWNITGVEKDFDGYYLYYKITSNANSNLALTFNPNGNYITADTYTGAAYQKFKLNLTGLEGFAANAKVAEGEKAGTIGGLLGNTVYVDTVSELESALDSTDPLTVVLGANLDMSSAGYSRIRDNKTLVGSYSARQLIDCQLRTNNEYGTVGDEPSDNIVIRNIDFVAKNVEDKILLQIWSSRQIWIDHNTFTSYLTRDKDEVGKFIWLNTPYDSYMDAKDNGRSPDYITISYCKFSNRYWTVAYGTQNSETTRCRTTLCYNWWDNCARRCPQIGNGIGHVYNNYYSFSGSGASEQIIVGDGCNMLSENCMFEGLTGHEMIGGGSSSSPFTDKGSYTASSIGGSASLINYKTSYGTSLTPKNHYGYSLLSAYGGNDTKTFCKAYAGCFSNLSSIVYITDSSQSSKPVTVYSAPHLVAIDVTDSGAVADFVDGSSWMIKNVNSGLYIDIEGGKAANGTNAQQWGAAEAGIQNTFRLFEAGDGYYYIASAVGDGATYVLDVSGKSSADGANIGLYQFNGGDNQKFKFTENADGSYKIRSKVSGDKSGIEIADAATGSGANVQQWSINGHACQDWILESATNFGCSMDTSVIYEFENVNSGMVMDIPGGNMEDGENVQQWSTGNFNSQRWTLKAFSGGGNYYYIHSVADPSFVLIANGGGNGGNVGIAKYSTSNSSMLFKFAKNLDGTYTILTRNSKDACLVEVGYASTSSGANVQQWSPTENACQDWNAVTFTTTTTTTTTTKATTTTTTSTTTTTKATTTTSTTTTTTKVTTTTATSTTTTTKATTTTPEATTTTITTTTMPVTTTTVSTPAPTTPPEIIYGDADCNGVVEITDVVRIMTHLTTPGGVLDEQGLLNADVYQRGDGIGNMDALSVQKSIAQLISSLPESYMD